ncbi:NAD-binding protein [Streptomyces sp. P9-A2]|uniref:NAD-binding protein n=1 Tax=Streptomyces sp. P9-A2 TaxID=3072284 RepID=UPI002FCC1926
MRSSVLVVLVVLMVGLEGFVAAVAAAGIRTCHDAGMRVIVVGAGQVGHTVVKSLAETPECAVIDIDETRLEAVSHAYDVQPRSEPCRRLHGDTFKE